MEGSNTQPGSMTPPNKPTLVAGGVLSLIAGVLQLGAAFVFITGAFSATSNIPIGPWFIITGTLGITGVLAIMGGIAALLRQGWRLAMAGAIAGLFGAFPFGIPAIIFIKRSRQEFADKPAQFIKSDKLSFAFRLFLGAMVLYAEVPKLKDVYKLSVYPVYRYNFFPMHATIFGHVVNVAQVFGTMGPYMGILIGLGLIVGAFTRLSAAGWGMMCLMFIVMKFDFMFIQGKSPAPCGCFTGLLANLKMNQSIWIDVASIPMSLQIILANRERKFLAAWSLLPEKLRQSWLQYIW
jgi:uncharacterized membrane protein